MFWTGRWKQADSLAYLEAVPEAALQGLLVIAYVQDLCLELGQASLEAVALQRDCLNDGLALNPLLVGSSIS